MTRQERRKRRRQRRRRMQAGILLSLVLVLGLIIALRAGKERETLEQISIHAPREGRDSKSEQISLHIFAKKAWIPDIFAQNAAFQSVLPLADRQKLLYLRCEPLRKFLRAFASHYKIIGSSGR